MPRGRKPKSETAVASIPETATNGPTNERIAAVLADYTVFDTSMSRLRQQVKTLLDNFEKEGGDKAELKALHKSLRLDPREAQAKLERKLRYHAGQGIVVSWMANGQGTVADALGPEMQAPDKNSLSQRRLLVVRAHSDGYNAGKSGAVPADNPYAHAPGSEEYVQWHDGRDDGQRDREAGTAGLKDRIAAATTADASLPAGALEDRPIF